MVYPIRLPKTLFQMHMDIRSRAGRPYSAWNALQVHVHEHACNFQYSEIMLTVAQMHSCLHFQLALTVAQMKP